MWHSDPEDRTISSVKSGHLKSVIWGQPTSVLTRFRSAVVSVGGRPARVDRRNMACHRLTDWRVWPAEVARRLGVTPCLNRITASRRRCSKASEYRVRAISPSRGDDVGRRIGDADSIVTLFVNIQIVPKHTDH